MGSPLHFEAQGQEAPPDLAADVEKEVFEDTEDIDDSLEQALATAPSSPDAPPLEAPYVSREEEDLATQKRPTPPPANSKRRPRRAPKKTTNLPARGDQNGRVKKRYIQHPNARRGLYRITKEGEYLYRVQPTTQRAAASLKIGVFNAPNFINEATGASFTDLYGEDQVIFLVDYEWPLSWLKNLSLKAGSGLLLAQGQGRLELSGLESQEKFTLVMLPNNGALVYRFKYWDRQWLIPFIEGGAGAYLFNETRDDGEPPVGRFGVALNAHATGGLGLSLSSLDRDAALRLDADYGINNIMFIAQVQQIIGFGTFDLTATVFSAGLTVQF